MSSNFDWSQFHEVNPQEKSNQFDWSQFKEAEKSPPKLQQAKRELGRTGKVIGSTLAGMPGDISQMVQNIPKYLAEKITGKETPEQASKILRALIPGGQLPTSEEISKGTEQVFPSLAPENDQEKEQEEHLSLLTSLLTPGPGGKAKAFKDPKTLDKLYKAGKSMGLSPKQLTPLFQKPLTTQIAMKAGGKSKGLEKALEFTKDALSDVYTKIGERAAKLPRLSDKVESDLLQKFADTKRLLGKTIQPSPDKQGAIHFIEKAIERVNNFGATPEELINFYHDINSAVNWSSIKNGKKVLGTLKKPVLEALGKSNPKIAKEFSNANALYSKFKDFERRIGPSKVGEYIELGKWAGLLTGLISGNVKKAAGSAAGLFVAPKISEKLLTDPKWQSLHKRILHSIKNHSKPAGLKAFQLLKEKVKKEMPEEYGQIDWDEFED